MLPMILSLLIIGLSVGAGGFLPANRTGFWIFFGLNALAGLAFPFFNSLQMAITQQSFKPEHLGRVMGMINGLVSLAGPVGLIFAGPLADAIGVEKVLVISGVDAIISGVLLYLMPVTRNYDKKLQKKLLTDLSEALKNKSNR
jgi:DHA3 family macrolide efflux protein-like MFS transporter